MMKKRTIALTTGALMILAATAVFGHGTGMMSCNQGVSVDTFKEFQYQTRDLRDSMMAKRFELRQEQAKETPDAARIAALKADLTALRTQIHDKGKPLGMFVDCDQDMTSLDNAGCGMGNGGGCGQGGGCGMGNGGGCGQGGGKGMGHRHGRGPANN